MINCEGRLRKTLLETPPEELLPWAVMRFGGTCATTLECLRKARTPREKELCAGAALLDLSEESIRACTEGDEELCERLLDARGHILQLLLDRGIEVRVRESSCGH